MPTYEFRCANGHAFDEFHKISDAPQTAVCPTCGAEGVRAISGGAGLVFKGSGFYLTDYGKNAHRGTAPAAGGDGKGGDAKSAEGKGGDAKGGDSKGESKGGGGSAGKDAGSKDAGSKAATGNTGGSSGGSSGSSSGGSSGGTSGGGSSSGGAAA